MTRFKNATAGMVIGIYGVFRLFFAAFNISFGGAAGFIRPIVDADGDRSGGKRRPSDRSGSS